MLAAHLHGMMGFQGNSADYYSPLNSLMTQVLARRTGIPITLALVYMEVARRRGITLLPIGLPGHVMIRHADHDDLYLDPFGVEALDAHACPERPAGTGRARHLPSGLLAALAPRPFLLRLLSNLKIAYLRADPPNIAGALAAGERILLLYPGMASELRDCGLLQERLGRRAPALLDLERYLSAAPEAGDADAVRERARVLYTALARLN